MTDIAYGTLEEIDGRRALRFERTIGHSVERVWRAVSDPAELGQWFPGAADWTPAQGETVDVGGAHLVVTEVDAPRRLVWTYADQQQSFELAEHEAGCVLTFVHVIDDAMPVAQTATGWETYLSRLEPHLAGSPLSEEVAHERWAETHERYAERFGVDPEPGRRFAAALRTGR